MGRDKLKRDNFNSTDCKTKTAKGQEGKKARKTKNTFQKTRPKVERPESTAMQISYFKKSEQYLHIFCQKQSGD